MAHRVVLLYAQSGAGKTSLLNAGLIPSLEQEGFVPLPTVRVRGLVADEFAARAKNIFVLNTLICWSDATADRNALLSVTIPEFLKSRPHRIDKDGFKQPYLMIFDQFEELFAFYPERWNEREDFFVQVSDALQQDPLLHALFVMREDFAASLHPYTQLMPERFATRFRLERLRPRAARDAAERPLQQTARRFAPNVAEHLVDQLLAIRVEDAAGRTREVKGEFVEPVQLQIAFESLWSELPPDVTVITDEHLRAYGDVNQALGEFYEQALTQTARDTGVGEDTLREWFDRRLITPAGTRGTVFRGTDSTEGVPNRAVDFLENRHLIRAEVRAGGRWYELTHDRFIRPIKASNDAWRKRLAQAALEARRRKAAWIGTALLVAVLAGSSFAAYRVRENGRTQIERQRRAQAVALAAGALLPSNRPEESVCLALRAADLGGPDEALQIENALRQTLRASRVRDVFKSPNEPIMATAFGAAGRWLVVTGGADNSAKVWEGEADHLVATRAHAKEPVSVALSRDGTLMVTATADGAVHVAKATGEPLFDVAEAGQFLTGPRFSPDGSLLLAISSDGTVPVWNVATHKRVVVLHAHDGEEVRAAAFNHDASRMVTATARGIARIWDVKSGKPLRELIGHRHALTDARFAPDGSTVLTASEDSTARIWSAFNGATLAELRGHAGRVYAAAYAPNGNSVVTAGDDRTARTWLTRTGELVATLRGHGNAVIGVAFSPEGRRVITASQDGTARLWDVGEGWLAALPPHLNANRVAFSDDSKELIVMGDDHVPYRADPRTGNTEPGPRGSVDMGDDLGAKYSSNPKWRSAAGESQALLATSEDRRLILTVSNSVATVRNASNDEAIRELTGHDGWITAAAFSADGSRVATGSTDSTVRVWATQGTADPVVLPHPEGVITVEFPRGPSPHTAKFLLTTSQTGTARVWDVTGGATIMELNGSVPVYAAFSPDATLVATARDNGVVVTYACETCVPLADLRKLAQGRLMTTRCEGER